MPLKNYGISKRYLDTSEQEGAEHAVQTRDQRLALRHVLYVKPRVKIVGRVEYVRQQEVEQSPELMQVVL